MSEESKTEDKELEELEAKILASSDEETAPETDEVPEEIVETENEPETKPENTDAPESKEEEPEPEPKTEPEPDNTAYAKMRHKLKEAERKLAEAQKPEATNDAADSSVDKLIEVWNDGVGDESAHLANIRKASSAELAAIYDKALAGEYGEHAEDVIKTVSEIMPVTKAREDQAYKNQRARSEQIRKTLDDEISMAKSDFPEFAEEGSEGEKFLNEYMADMAGELNQETGELDGNGKLPDDLALYLHTHPYVAHQLANKVFNAQSKNSEASRTETAKLSKELSAIKERLAKYESVETPSSSASVDDDGSGDDLEALERKILAAAGG